MKPKWNKTILCIDDEESILNAYKDILAPLEKEAGSLADLKDAMSDLYEETKEKNFPVYHLLFASSGEEAVEIATREKAAGRDIAVGFFDMRMRTKMDGVDTIAALKEIFPLLLCAVVTAYSDCSLERIGSLFANHDEWVYFNKPFTRGELVQIAANLVASWNIRRENQTYINDLIRLINCISEIKQIAFGDLKKLLEAILHQVIDFAGSRNGFLVTVDEKLKKFNFEVGIGDYATPDILTSETIMQLNDIIVDDLSCGLVRKVKDFIALSVRAVCFDFVIVYLDMELIDPNDKRIVNLLEILVKNISSAITTAKNYERVLASSKEVN